MQCCVLFSGRGKCVYHLTLGSLILLVPHYTMFPVGYCFLAYVKPFSGPFRYSSIGILTGSKTSFEKNCFPAWASTLNMGLINKVDMVCLSPVGYGV